MPGSSMETLYRLFTIGWLATINLEQVAKVGGDSKRVVMGEFKKNLSVRCVYRSEV